MEAAVAAEPPWDTKLTESEDLTTLVLRRGDETIEINWGFRENGSQYLEHPLCYSLLGVRDIRLRNVAEAMRVIAGRPDYTTKKARKKAVVEKAEPEEVVSMPLPFDPQTSSDVDIRRAVSGKSLTWRGGMTGEYFTGTVPPRRRVEVPDGKGGKKFVLRVSPNVYITTTEDGKRVLTFPAVNEQFRSCYLESLVQVV